jgi:hypothetical protein
MGTRTANFGRLVSAFHFEILGDSTQKYVADLYRLRRLPSSSRAARNTCSHHPEQSGKPKIIANFLNPGNVLQRFYRVASQSHDG